MFMAGQKPTCLDVIDDKRHELLDPPSPAYSCVTVRRAFIVWMSCGQRNTFKEVCNYFHYLEALEEQLPESRRASSRLLELNLFTEQPPTSPYLAHHFPTLYTGAQLFQQPVGRANTSAHRNRFSEPQQPKNLTRACTPKVEIVGAGVMIRDYCRSHTKTLGMFSREFRAHAEVCGLGNAVADVVLYIKRKLIQAEIHLGANYALASELLAGTDDAKRRHSSQASAAVLAEGPPLHTISPVMLKPKTGSNKSRKAMRQASQATAKNLLDKLKFSNKHKTKHAAGSPENVADDAFDVLQTDITETIKRRCKKFSDLDFITKEYIIKL